MSRRSPPRRCVAVCLRSSVLLLFLAAPRASSALSLGGHLPLLTGKIVTPLDRQQTTRLENRMKCSLSRLSLLALPSCSPSEVSRYLMSFNCCVLPVSDGLIIVSINIFSGVVHAAKHAVTIQIAEMRCFCPQFDCPWSIHLAANRNLHCKVSGRGAQWLWDPSQPRVS